MITWAWVLAIVLFFARPSPYRVDRLRELVAISVVTAWASDTEEDASVLISIASLESGFVIRALGSRGEIGPWQLMPPAPKRLRDQAKEALRRWKVLGPKGYTGEGKCPCPLARNRALRAAMIQATWGGVILELPLNSSTSEENEKPLPSRDTIVGMVLSMFVDGTLLDSTD